jgi:hypothetical protein
VITRRATSLGLAALSLAAISHAHGSEPLVTVNKDPNCGCCAEWAAHVRAAGFPVELRDTNELNRIKARLGVPADLASCHTARVAGYIIEGHVPASAIRRLLTDKPTAAGLAVRGMPVGSPGMEVPGTQPEEYDVVLFGKQRRVFARFRGHDELPLR